MALPPHAPIPFLATTLLNFSVKLPAGRPLGAEPFRDTAGAEGGRASLPLRRSSGVEGRSGQDSFQLLLALAPPPQNLPLLLGLDSRIVG